MPVQVPDGDESSMTAQQVQAFIDCCMGGRVAEELLFGLEQVPTSEQLTQCLILFCCPLLSQCPLLDVYSTCSGICLHTEHAQLWPACRQM